MQPANEEKIKKSALVMLRDGRPTDLPFIYASWLKGLRYGNDWFGAIDQGIYFKAYHKVLESVLLRSTVKVACLIDEPDAILGYSVTSGTKVHWVFVKKHWRGIGLARDLLPVQPTIVTHVTKVGLSILKKSNSVIFDPFSL